MAIVYNTADSVIQITVRPRKRRYECLNEAVSGGRV